MSVVGHADLSFVLVTRIFLLRHGQSEWNALGRWQGQANPPLTELGRLQALHGASRIGSVDAIACSTLERAQVTASIISQQLGIGPVIEFPQLVERSAGEWEGLTRPEIEDQYPGFLSEHRRPPGWESDEHLVERASAAITALAMSIDGDIVAVTHGGLIYAIEKHLGAPFATIANLGGRWVEVVEDRWTLGERVNLLEGAEITVPEQI